MTGERGPVRAVIFDMDGVIVDTEPVWARTRAEFAAGLGRTWDHDDQRHVAGVSSREWSEIMRARLGIDMPEQEIQERIVGTIVERLLRDGPPPIDGAVDAVRRLTARYPSALASGAHRDIIEAVLAATGLADAFRVVISGDEVGRGKPAPDIFLEAARRLGEDPADCLVIEDSVFGVRAGIAAGMLVVLVPNPNAPDPEVARREAHHVVERLGLVDPERLGPGPRP